MESVANVAHCEPWNKGEVVGQKAPFKLGDPWALRVCFQMESRVRELAPFNLEIDSKPPGLRPCQPEGPRHLKWTKRAELKSDRFVFSRRIHDSPHLGTRQVRPHSRRLGRGART